MGSRPTPFGLFAGVMAGRLGSATSAVLRDIAQHRKRARADMGWVLALVRRLEQEMDDDAVETLTVEASSAVVRDDDRLLLLQSTLLADPSAAPTGCVSIRTSPVVTEVLGRAQAPLAVGRLLNDVTRDHPDWPRDRLATLVRRLLAEEFLLSSLRPPPSAGDPLEHLTKELSGCAPTPSLAAVLADVRAIAEEQTAYDRCAIGGGLAVHQRLQSRMRRLSDRETTLQLDTALAGDVRLPRHVGHEVAKAVTALWRLAPDRRGMVHLRSYQEFLERYGVDQTVPVLELLDDDRGLGPPAGYQSPVGSRGPVEDEDTGCHHGDERDRLLMRLATSALVRGEREVELTEQLVERLARRSPPADLPQPSAELYATLVAASPSAVDDEDFRLVIGPNPGTHEAGVSLTRFLDILPPETETTLRTFRQKAEKHGPVPVDLVYQSRWARSANITIVPQWSDHRVVVGVVRGQSSATTLPLEDLNIGSTLDRLYVISTSLGTEVAVQANHMLNARTQAPNVCRFLSEISHEPYRLWAPFDWGSASHCPVLPRVRYSKTILLPVLWKLDAELCCPGADVRRGSEWREELDAWRRRWQVPRHVLMGVDDQRIMVDLENELHLLALRREAAGSPKLVLQEIPGGEESNWLANRHGPFASECVFVLSGVRSPTGGSARSVGDKRPAPSRRPSRHDVVRLPGSDWLFAKLYGSKSREDQVIAAALPDLVQPAVEAGAVQLWFYIRYANPEPHLRLRFQGAPDDLLRAVLPALRGWSEEMVARGLRTRVILDTYEREVDRYGGPEAIDAAESVFAADSVTSIELLRILRSDATDLAPVEMAAASLVDLLVGLDGDEREWRYWLERTGAKADYRTEYIQRRHTALSVTDPEGDWHGLRNTRGGEAVLAALALRRPALAAFGRLTRDLDAAGALWSPRERVAGSLLHMHCNRLFGADREREGKALALARNSVWERDQRARRRR